MDEPGTFHSHRSLSCVLSLVVFVATFLASGPLLARAGTVPQQGGAVPLSQGIADLASQLAKGIPEGRPMTVAVTDFPDLGGQTCRLGRYVAERLSTLMSQHPQCRLVERRRLDMVLQELKFSISELVDPAKARKLGQMLGVQGLVIGTISDVGSTLDMDARIIDIQTNVSLPGASASIVKDEAVRGLSADCAGATVAGGAAAGLSPGGPPDKQASVSGAPVQRAVARLIVNDFTFEVKTCRRTETKVTCSLTVTDGGEDDEMQLFSGSQWGTRSARMIDNLGAEYTAKSLQVGNKSSVNSGDTVRASFTSGIPMGAKLVFEDVSTDASSISLLEIPCISHHRGREFKAQIRNIPIMK